MNAGRYPHTLTILQKTSSGKSSFGHSVVLWNEVGFAACRIWQDSNVERAARPVENTSRSVRLLCRAVTLDASKRVIWNGQTYRIALAEWRDAWDTLITIEPVENQPSHSVVGGSITGAATVS